MKKPMKNIPNPLTELTSITEAHTIDDIIAHIMENKKAAGDKPYIQLKRWPKLDSEPFDFNVCKICGEEKPIDQFRLQEIWRTDENGNRLGVKMIRYNTCRRCQLDRKYRRRHSEDKPEENYDEYLNYINNCVYCPRN